MWVQQPRAVYVKPGIAAPTLSELETKTRNLRRRIKITGKESQASSAVALSWRLDHFKLLGTNPDYPSSFSSFSFSRSFLLILTPYSSALFRTVQIGSSRGRDPLSSVIPVAVTVSLSPQLSSLTRSSWLVLERRLSTSAA